MKQKVLFNRLAQGYDQSAYFAEDLAGLKTSLAQAKQSKVSTLIEIKVDPSSMSGGYESWWRVGVPEVSNEKKVETAHIDMAENIKLAKQY